MPAILITGASGFIGSHLAEQGLAEGYEVWCAIRPSSSRQYLTDARLHLIVLDMSSDAALAQQIAEHVAAHGAWDFCIHAAGATKCLHPADFRRTNTEGTARLYRTLIAQSALRRRFVFISSLSVMGKVGGDDIHHVISASDTPQPDTQYGISKLAAEDALREVRQSAGAACPDYIILRPTGVYGPRERDYFMMADSLRRHIDFAVGYRQQVITFIYVDDLVRAAYLATERGTSGAAYFLTDGGEYDSRTFSDLLQEAMGVGRVLHIKAPLWLLRLVCTVSGAIGRFTGKATTLNTDKYRILAQRNWRCDITPARHDLGYCPAWPLERGVSAAVAWYKAQGWL